MCVSICVGGCKGLGVSIRVGGWCQFQAVLLANRASFLRDVARPRYCIIEHLSQNGWIISYLIGFVSSACNILRKTKHAQA